MLCPDQSVVAQGTLDILIQNLYYCEWLLLEYMQTSVYYTPYMANQTCTHISVNLASVSGVVEGERGKTPFPQIFCWRNAVPHLLSGYGEC